VLGCSSRGVASALIHLVVAIGLLTGTTASARAAQPEDERGVDAGAPDAAAAPTPPPAPVQPPPAPTTTDAGAPAEPLAPPPVAAPRPAVPPVAAVVDPDDEEHIDYDTPRTEPAGFLIVGGNSDIGLQFGLAGRLARFAHGSKPYVFRADLLLTASVRDSGGSVGVAQQEYIVQFDIPHLFGGRVRTTPGMQFFNFVDAGYFGRGNATSATLPDVVQGNPERYFQHRARELRLRDFTRVRLKKPVDLMIAPILRYHDHAAYDGSKLDIDNRNGLVRGLRKLFITSLAIGIVFDTRDNELFPHKGMYHQVGQRFEQGYPIDGDVQAASTGAILTGYLPLGSGFVAAGRMVLDSLYGKVPYMDLYNAGPFNDWEMPGGANGIRGVPWGRYSAPIKAIVNTELRFMHWRFKLIGQHFRLGNDVFLDAGRVFDNYRFDSKRDGRGLGLKWGVGGGVYLQWGSAAIFRVELAYSPDAVEANPRFPLGLYIADGVMF